MKKKTQRIYATILTVLVSVAMIGSGFLGYFLDGGAQPADSQNANKSVNAAAEYQATKLRIEAMVKQAKVDPGNVPLQTALGNEYYDAGGVAEQAAPTEAKEHFKHAVEAYQNVLKTNKDPNVMVDMSTAAFKSGDNVLAEKSFKEVLALKPDFYAGLLNYGVFLANVKQDLPGAISQWEKAQKIASNSTEKDQIKSLISQAQSALKTNPEAQGTSNPNPAVNNTTGK